jgi:predicted transcriptional regulator
VLTDLINLNRIRLEGDLTYDRLSEMTQIHPRTLYRILTTPNARVHDRTLFKIQRFLAKSARPARVVRMEATS